MRSITIACLLASLVSILNCSAVFEVSQRNSLTTNQVETPLEDLLMDVVLAELRNYLVANKDTVISIPPISTGFEYDVIGIPFTGWFNTTEGSFTNPATIRRVGPVNVTHSGGKVVASMSVCFSQLDVNFPHYSASVVGISETGSVDVQIQYNSVFIEISVYYLPHCIVSISRLEVTKMGGIMVDITGLGVLNSIESQIVAWILQSSRTTFTTVVENVVKNKLQEELAKTRICKFKKPF